MNPGEYLNGLDGPHWGQSADSGKALSSTVLTFDEQRSSAFAKSVAGDFNPLHDVGQSRFCVPGDLLFAALVSRYGLYAHTSVSFANMLPARSRLALPADIGNRLMLIDERDRQVLSLFVEGDCLADAWFSENLVTEYVQFSGRAFPELLVPMMREAEVMVNPSRPLVIYKDMAIRLDAPAVEKGMSDRQSLTLIPQKQMLEVSEKKGAASIQFSIELDGARVGEGEKQIVLGGLRPYNEALISTVVDEYGARKHAWGQA